MKKLCAILLITGLALFLCGVTDINSNESLTGGLLVIIGFILLVRILRKEKEKNKNNIPPYRNSKTWKDK